MHVVQCGLEVVNVGELFLAWASLIVERLVEGRFGRSKCWSGRDGEMPVITSIGQRGTPSVREMSREMEALFKAEETVSTRDGQSIEARPNSGRSARMVASTAGMRDSTVSFDPSA